MNLKIKKRSLGFTLIEILISIVILSILAGVAAPLLAFSIDAIQFHIARMDMEQSASAAFARMTREIRRLRDDSSVVTATAVEYTFTNIEGIQIGYSLV